MVYTYYGKEKVEFDLPSHWNLLAHCKVLEPPDAGDVELEKALNYPIGTPKLSEIAGKGRKAIVLSDDCQRPTPAFRIIPKVLNELNEGGIRDENIKLIAASGTHLKPANEVVEQKYGKEVLDRVELIYHSEKYIDDRKELAYIGQTKRKNRIYINKEVASADVKVGVGLIAPHAIGGFGGGAKIILPGVSGRETIVCNHLLCNHPRVHIGIVDGNPVREEMEEVARKVGLDFIVNVVVNSGRELVRAVAGDVVKAHREGVKEWRKLYEVRVQRAADVVITSSTPFDTHLHQSMRATMYADDVCKDGGLIIQACRPPEGVRKGTYDILTRVRPCARFQKIVQALKEGEREDELARMLIYPEMAIIFSSSIIPMMEKKKIMIVSDCINQKEANEMGFRYAKTIEEAVDSAEKMFSQADVIVVQNAIPLPVLSSRRLRM